MAEFGQFGFSTQNRKEGAIIKSFGVGQRNVKMSYIFEHEKDWSFGDISGYVPNEAGIMQQVVENEKNKKARG